MDYRHRFEEKKLRRTRRKATHRIARKHRRVFCMKGDFVSKALDIRNIMTMYVRDGEWHI